MADNYILPFLWMKGESQEIIREEIEKIDECGIKAICLESRPHPDFLGERWWDDLAFIIREAKQRQMKIWVLDDSHFPTGYANGLIKSKYPERRKRYLRYNTVNVWGKTGEVTISVHQMLKPLVSFMELDKPIDMEERTENKLVAVTAYPLRGDCKLDESGAIDLTDKVKGDYLTWRFPKENYRLFVIYETCTDGGKSDYINMMDKESVSTLIEAVYEPHYQRFKEEFGSTIAGFFSDEPEIGNIDGFSPDTQIGQSNMPLPWSETLKQRFRKKHGARWRETLAYLWTETTQMQECPQTRFSFMDIVTGLYRENFSLQLGNWCEEHQVEYIGHVVEDENLHQRLGNGSGHYFRAMAGQHMAGIDVIGDQVTIGDRGYRRSGLFKRDGAFFHYALAKLGASEGHLNPAKKGRTMCELFGASGWHTGVRDMKYILDHLLVRGINYLVPHAFSMSEYPDPDCPPHFYARGNNPQFKHFVSLMKYANRMCGLLNGGAHVAPVAVLYAAESEWSGPAMLIQEPARELQEHQIEFDFVSADMLGEVTGSSLDIAGQQFRYLIIPACEYLPAKVFRFISEKLDVPVIFIDQKPTAMAGEEVSEKELHRVFERADVISLQDLGKYLQKLTAGEVRSGCEFPELVYYHYHKDHHIHVFHNESAYDTYRGEIMLPLENEAVYYDGMDDCYYQLPVRKEEGKKLVEIELAPYQLGVIIDMKSGVYPKYRKLSEKLSACPECRKISGSWRFSVATEKQYPKFTIPEPMSSLGPFSNFLPEFSGHICYEKEIEISQVTGNIYLEFTEVYEVAELWINEINLGTRLHPPYIFEITEAVKKGNNKIRVIVTSTLDHDQTNHPEPFIIMDHHVSEPTGLSGDVNLYLS